MTEKNIKVHIDDILECIDKIIEYIENIDEDRFIRNTQVHDAVIRRIEIIGEAANNIPRELQDKYKETPWEDIIGMRNVLIHQYGGVDLFRVWSVAKNRMPELKEKMLSLKEKEFTSDK